MKIRIIGAGFYGCHIAVELLAAGHEVTILEVKDEIFGGASGKIPARLHQGFHYPRSKRTRDACREHLPEFMDAYGTFTRHVVSNIYAIAEGGSLVDYPQYVDTLSGEVRFKEVRPEDYGLTNVEGALLTTERHILVNSVREYFEGVLADNLFCGVKPGKIDDPAYALTIDATFCAYDSAGVDRYEPCIVGLLQGDTSRAVTVMDGPFSSVYPWDEGRCLCSISSAKWTPVTKQCRTWAEANAMLDALSEEDIGLRVEEMVDDLAQYYGAVRQFDIVGGMTSVRAMPLSGADARLVDVVDVGERAVRIRAGKIDAVIHAARLIRERLNA